MTFNVLSHGVRWLVLVVFGALAFSFANAAPTVDIRAQSRLALEKAKLRGDGSIEVTGQLVDKLTNDGLPSASINVKMGGAAELAYTDSDGRFRAVFFGVVPGPQPVELRFAGSAKIDKAEPVLVVVDPARAQVTLNVTAAAATGGMNLLITAQVEGAGDVASSSSPSLSVNVSVGDATADELEQKGTHLVGDKPYFLSRAAAGGPGPKRVRVIFPGDSTRQQATAETTFDLTSTTVTTMEVADSTVDYEDDVVVTGKVVDEEGKAVARAQVALSAISPHAGGDRRLAAGATDDDGTYKFEIEAEIVGNEPTALPKDFSVQVQTDPVSTFVRPSRSTPAIVKIAAPQPVPVSYTVAAFLATALAAAGFFIARAKPWKRFQKAVAPAEAPMGPGLTDDDSLQGGLVANKPGLVSTLRRPSDDGFSGMVRDTVRGRPIADAIVRVVLGDYEREVRTAEDGTFAVEKLPMGELRAEVGAPGHVTEKFSLSVPHRGELRGVRVDLVPVRERVFQLYRRAAEPALPEARLWGIWSPRQIVDHVRAKRPSPVMSELTDFVEEIYFSSRLASESVLPAASERVDRAIRERARPAA
jgi:hypothetical protein